MMQPLYRFALSYLLLLTGVKPDNLYPLIHHEMQVICIGAELLDEREKPYTFTRPHEWHGDVLMIRQRLHELRNAPYVSEHHRFPIDRAVCIEFTSFNKRHQRHLEILKELYPLQAEHIDKILTESVMLFNAWDMLGDSKVGYYYTHIRRAALAKLRDMIGAEAFDRGEMPMHIPLWRFEVIR